MSESLLRIGHASALGPTPWPVQSPPPAAPDVTDARELAPGMARFWMRRRFSAELRLDDSVPSEPGASA